MNAIIEQNKDAAASYLTKRERRQFFEEMDIVRQKMLDKDLGAKDVEEDAC